ncbi:PQQ-binding-like beta-propeller repeat protein [Streptomyces sp. NPDC005907]|uniref:outer membrane protein assembly factor BamB family protein n=1 Tax=Streptomyces sp. NPDC005907 TaxID=3154571 RepID=UPI00340FF500
MTTEHVEEKIRDTLHAVALDRVRAPGDLAEKVVRRHTRRRLTQAAGAVAAVTAITAGAVFGLDAGTTTEQPPPTRPAASPQGWQPWRNATPGATERHCLVDGSALYCSGTKYDVAKFDANTGKRLWTVKVNREGDGISGPFAARDGVVYTYRNHTAHNTPDGDYAGGTDLMAVDADNGTTLWKAEMPQDDRTDQAAMLIDGAVLANTPTLRTMSALDPLTGKEKWRHTWDKGTVCQRAVLSGTPHLLCTRDTEKPHDSELLRLDPETGNTEKTTTVPGRQQLLGTSRNRLVLLEDNSTPGQNRRVTTFTKTGERTTHPYPLEGRLAKLDLVGDHLIAVTWKGTATAYSPTTGKTLWTSPAGIKMPPSDTMTGIASPVVSAAQGTVYFYGPNGDLSGLDLRTGKQVWHTHIAPPETGPHYGPSPQLLRYEDTLITRNGSKIVSLLPPTGH